MVSGLRLHLQNSGCSNALTVLCVACWNMVYVFYCNALWKTESLGFLCNSGEDFGTYRI